MVQTHDHSIYRLVWGDGYFKGHEEDQLENERLQRGGVEEEHQLLRKKLLSELQALVGVKDQDDASGFPGADYVSDIEWFYLGSMSYSFQQGVGYVTQVTHCPWMALSINLLMMKFRLCIHEDFLMCNYLDTSLSNACIIQVVIQSILSTSKSYQGPVANVSLNFNRPSVDLQSTTFCFVTGVFMCLPSMDGFLLTRVVKFMIMEFQAIE